MKSSHKKHLRRTLLCALVAGSIAAPFAVPHAYALPIEGANAATNAGEANISTSGTTMDITGKTAHNILRWEDFSIEQNEKVRFDGGAQTRDYLNLVTGEGASNIYGTIEGGRNVYLVNPHGILFAKGSEVNTGALYLSTANVDAVASAAGTSWGGNSPLSASTQYGNVLNLGTVQTAKLYIEGKNVTVLNTDAVTDGNGAALTGSAVTIRSAETPHIGYDVGNKTTRNFDVNGTATPHDVSDYAHPNTAASATSRGWYVATILSAFAHTDYDYMRVHDVYELQHIAAKMNGRYMLAGNIDAGVTNTWNRTSNGIEGFHPIGGNGSSDAKFMGTFDGVGHTIEGLYIRHIDQNQIGLFGNVRATGRNIGGIAGHVQDSTIQNALHMGTVIRQGSGIEASVGGIVGNAESEKINHVVWKSGSVTQEGGAFTADAVGVSSFVRTTDVQECTDAQLKQTATYTDWKDEDDKAVVATEGGKGTPWRIYDGKTTPLLTGLMKGTKRLEKIYDGKTFGAGDAHIHMDGTAEKNIGAYDAQGTYSDAFGYDLIGSTYRITPRVLSVGTVAAQSKTYDGNTSADASKFHAALVGVVSGDENLVSVTATGAAYNSKDVAAANTVNYTGVALGGTGAGNYRIASTVQGAGRITAKQLNLALMGGARFDKTYDGTANVTQSLTKDRNYTLTNFVNGEGADIALAPVTGTYTDKNAGTGKAVTFGGLTLTGTGAGNYSISATTLTATGDIARKTLTLEGMAGTQFTKTYDGTATVTQSLARGTNYRLAGVVEGEGTNIVALNESAAQGAYATKDAQVAGTQQNVTFTNLSLTGTGAGNYTLAAHKTFENAGRITPRELNLALASGARFDKTYDGNANVTQTLTKGTNYSLTGFIGTEGDHLALAAATGTYTDKNAAADKAVTFDGLTLTGTGAGNYTLNKTALTGTGTISPKQLNLALTGGARFDKTYDGNANVTQTLTKDGNYTLSNFVNGEGEGLALAPVTGTYTDKNAGTGKAVTFGGLTLTGTGAGNYVLNKTALTGTGTITPRALTLALTGDVRFDKTYDGNANVTQTLTKDGNYSLTGFVTGEGADIELDAVTGKYADKNAARDKAVTFGGLTLTGMGAGNYVLNKTALTGTGTISPKTLNLALTGDVRFDKTYDGNANVTQTLTKDGNYTLSNFVNGEGEGLALAPVTGTYTDKNAGTGKAVTFGGLTLTGMGAGNYVLTKTALTGTGTISPKTLNLALTSGVRFDKTYDGNANVTQTLTKGRNYTLTNFVNGEGADIALAPVTGTYTDKNAGTGKAVTFGGLTLTGTGAGNYVLNTSTLAGTGTIAHRDLTLTADAKSIVQDGPLPAFTGQASGFAEGEDASVFGADGITFGTTVTNTDRPSRYDIIGRVGGVSDGVVGNYRIRQAAGNARAFTVYAAVPGGILASLVQNAAPRFDMGFGQEVYVFGLPRPIPTARLGIYRFRAARDFNIEGLRLD